MRGNIKVYENTPGAHLKVNIATKEVVFSNLDYTSVVFKKYSASDIIYDERMICCFYHGHDHPHRNLFNDLLLGIFKIFTHYGYTVILDRVVDNVANIVLYPHDKVKQFKTDKEGK